MVKINDLEKIRIATTKNEVTGRMELLLVAQKFGKLCLPLNQIYSLM
jgi:hypothetical protein